MLISKRGTETETILVRTVVGTVAGIVATEAMTVCAAHLFRTLPQKERYPLPPREITERMMWSNGFTRSRQVLGATLGTHFLFGAAMGALYYLAFPARSRSPTSTIAYASLVWAVSYFGWVPAFGLLRPAHHHPARRNALMIVAHIFWALILWASGHLLLRSLAPLRAGELRDADFSLGPKTLKIPSRKHA